MRCVAASEGCWCQREREKRMLKAIERGAGGEGIARWIWSTRKEGGSERESRTRCGMSLRAEMAKAAACGWLGEETA